MKKLGIAFLVVTLALFSLAGCTTTDRGKTQAQGTAVGAAAGAGFGAIIGGIFGGGRGVAIGALTGAAVGAAAGHAYGTHVANEKEKYAAEEDWLDACLASAQEVNQETREYNATLAQEIDQMDRETAQLAAAYRNKKAQKTALVKKREVVEAKLKKAREKLDYARWELQNQQKVLADAKRSGKRQYVKSLENEIQELKQYVAELEAHTESLASLSNRMAV